MWRISRVALAKTPQFSAHGVFVALAPVRIRKLTKQAVLFVALAPIIFIFVFVALAPGKARWFA